MRKTESRQAALEKIKNGKVTYDSVTGTFAESGEPITGARRRTFAELRTAGLVSTPAGGSGVLRLSEEGADLLAEWVA